MGLIRGTQLAGHTVRMGGQSLKDWLRIISILWFVLLFLILYLKVDEIHISHIKGNALAIWHKIGSKETKVALIHREDTIKKRDFYIKATDELKLPKNPKALKQVVSYYYQPESIIKNNVSNSEWLALNNIWWSTLWQSLAIAVGLMSVIVIFLAKRGGRTKKDSFVRGREMTTAENLNKLIAKENKKEKIKHPYSVAGISFPPKGEMEHLIISGVTGTGKTVIIKDLLKQIKDKGDKAIIYDYTGSFIEGFYDEEKDILINPFDKRSKSWSLLSEVDSEAEFDTIAEALIGNSDSISDPFWPNGARLIFSELCKIQYRKKNFNIQDLYKYLTLEPKDLNQILANSVANNFTNPKAEKTSLSLLMLLASYLKGLQYINNGNDREKDFSIKKWVLDREKNNMVFLSSRSSLHSSIQPLISAMMDIAINNIGELSIGAQQRTWLIFDEVASLNYLPSLEKGLTVSRNFGGCFVIALQSISQLTKRYGMQDTETIASNCSNKIILKAGNNNTARWASQLLGTEEIEQYREGLSYGAHEMRDGVNLNKTQVERSLALASEILSLPKLQGYALMTGGYPVAPINFGYLKNNEQLFNNVSFEEKNKA